MLRIQWLRAWPHIGPLGWWSLLIVCLIYSAYALVMALLVVLAPLGLVTAGPVRAAPVVFVIHALAGAVVLPIGLAQLTRAVRRRWPTLHRRLGRLYVGAIWIASTSGLWLTVTFAVSSAAKLAFAALAILWFATTTLAFIRIRQGQVAAHRAWMIRSYALSLFFVTDSLWPDLLASTGLPLAISYPLATFLSWGLNLAVAEWWLRRTRARGAAV